jgi:hypothetical protein
MAGIVCPAPLLSLHLDAMHYSQSTLPFLLFLLITAVVSSCSDSRVSKLGESCTKASDCDDALFCLQNVCQGIGTQPQDATNSPDIIPVEDVSGQLCNTDQDCWPEAVCLQGSCGRECVTDQECATQDMVCKDWRCAPPTSPTQDTTSSVDVPSTPDTPNTQPDTTQPPPDNSTPALKSYGEPCGSGSECESTLCAGVAANGSGMCTKACNSILGPSECPGTDMCYDLGPDQSICAPSDVGQPTSCTVPGCFGPSLQNEQGECICTAKCVQAIHCPAAMVCSPTQLGATGVVDLCVPVGGACSQSNEAQCFGVCVLVDNMNGLCTAVCDQHTDCLSNMTCQGTETGVQVCAP